MIAAGYAMDVYCSNEGHCAGHTWEGDSRASFYGQTAAECRALARKKGWRFINSNQEVICKACVNATRKKK